MNELTNFANGLNACNLSDTEIGLYSALILLSVDRPGLTEQKLVMKTREKIAEALRVQIIRSRPNTANAMQIMPALEAKIMELRSLGARHSHHLDWLRINWHYSSRLPPLFVEIFDIPKSEEDLQWTLHMQWCFAIASSIDWRKNWKVKKLFPPNKVLLPLLFWFVSPPAPPFTKNQPNVRFLLLDFFIVLNQVSSAKYEILVLMRQDYDGRKKRRGKTNCELLE